MKNSDKVKAFKDELPYIRDGKIRTFAMCAIESLPDYFFEVQAASTGKYHPAYTLGEGGLVRHVRAAVRIFIELSVIDVYKFTQEQIDLMIVALMLHDGWKLGTERAEFTPTSHPLIAVEQLSKNEELRSLITPEQFDFIMSCIKTHMGQWNKDYKTGEEVLEVPANKYQHVVHLSDFLSSRKCLVMDFDVPLSKR